MNHEKLITDILNELSAAQTALCDEREHVKTTQILKTQILILRLLATVLDEILFAQRTASGDTGVTP